MTELAPADRDRLDLVAMLDRAEKRSSHENILGLARHEARPVLPEQLDRHTLWLNCLNGTLDLTTGQLRPHDSADLITHLVPVAWDPAAPCLLWEGFIDTVCGGDTELSSYLQRCVGYSLTGEVREQVVFLLHGDGANGKSTFLLTLLHLLGNCAGQPTAAC